MDKTSKPKGLSLPSLEQPEQTYLIETEDGFLVNVPESRLESWQGGAGKLSPSRKKLLVGMLAQRISSSKK